MWRQWKQKRTQGPFPRPQVPRLPSPNDPGRLVHAQVAKRLGVKPDALAGLMDEGLLARPVTGTTAGSGWVSKTGLLDLWTVADVEEAKRRIALKAQQGA
jgi:hypothetical protein